MQFHLSTVVWGPWHTGVFLDFNLPSLLAPGNLPAFAARHDVVYRIQTSAQDLPKIAESEAFLRAQEILKIELLSSDVAGFQGPIEAHHALWRRSIKDAADASAMILFIPPDVIWSNASLGHVADLVSEGKRAVFMTYLRVVSETCPAEVKRLHSRPESIVINAPARELVALSLRHIHPLALTYKRDSANFPVHPEFILWPVAGEGFLMRVLVREMFAYDPALFELNQAALLAKRPDPALIHYITDSDDLFSLSLAPQMKDIEWYANPRRVDPLEIGSWWLAYDSPANDLVAKECFHIHATPRSPAKWRRVELESDVLMHRLIGTRNLLRALKSMEAEELCGAREILAFALIETKLARFASRNANVTLLLPTTEAVARWLRAGGEGVITSISRRLLLEWLLDHVILHEWQMTPGRDEVLVTATGSSRRLAWRGDRAFVDGISVRTRPVTLGLYRGYLIDEVLPLQQDVESGLVPWALRKRGVRAAGGTAFGSDALTRRL